MEKKLIRKQILKIRDELDKDIKKNMDRKIEEKFMNSIEYKNAKKIFIYISYKSEINTKSIILKMLGDEKEIYVPRTDIKSKCMDAVKINSFDNLVEDVYGILEPSFKEKSIDPNELDLIVVPGVAFDRKLSRLGYGAGYYDKYFKTITKRNISKVALAYNFQIIDEVPIDKYDVPVDCILTNDNEIR